MFKFGRYGIRKGLIWRGRNKWIRSGKIEKMVVDPVILPPNKIPGIEEYHIFVAYSLNFWRNNIFPRFLLSSVFLASLTQMNISILKKRISFSIVDYIEYLLRTGIINYLYFKKSFSSITWKNEKWLKNLENASCTKTM